VLLAHTRQAVCQHARVARTPEPSAELTILQASRKTPTLLLFFGAAFTVVGGAMVVQGDAAGWFVLPTFGLLTLLALALLARPGQLSLTEAGMTVTYLGRQRPLLAWSRCSNFRTWSYKSGPTRVTFDYDRPAPLAETRTAYVLNTLGGGNARLPDTYGMKAEALVDLLRQRAETAHTAQETERG
jgi:hypothetical protein